MMFRLSAQRSSLALLALLLLTSFSTPLARRHDNPLFNLPQPGNPYPAREACWLIIPPYEVAEWACRIEAENWRSAWLYIRADRIYALSLYGGDVWLNDLWRWYGEPTYARITGRFAFATWNAGGGSTLSALLERSGRIRSLRLAAPRG